MPPSNASHAETDFLRSQEGSILQRAFWYRRSSARLIDACFDLRLWFNRSFRRYRRHATEKPIFKVLVVGVDVPSRSADLQRIFSRLLESRHTVTCVAQPMQSGLGKFQNINRALESCSPDEFDWLVVTDDDITVPDAFLDTLLDLATQENMKICMPAHRFHSYLGFLVTLRHWGSLARVTRYVECGPLTAFHKDVYPAVLPFPELRWAWGNDVGWAQMAWDRNITIGVVDACAVEHLRPVAASYSKDDALAEGEAYMKQAGVRRSRVDFLQTVRSVHTIR